MGVVRVHKNKDYTVMSNHHLKNKNLSLKAKGLLSVMLSLPDDWDYSIKGLNLILKDGTKAIRNALKEIEVNGYLKRTRVNGEGGKYEYVYDIFETPNFDNQPYYPLGHAVKGHTLEGYTLKGTQLNTNISSTKELNTNILNTQSIYTEDDIRKQIEVETLSDNDRLNEIILIIKDVLNSKNKTIRVAREEKNINEVKDVFLKLRNFHIEYVFYCLEKNTTKVTDIKSYLITCLYNATLTINSYYDLKVKHDLLFGGND